MMTLTAGTTVKNEQGQNLEVTRRIFQNPNSVSELSKGSFEIITGWSQEVQLGSHFVGK